MKLDITTFKTWYEMRQLREKILVVLLSWTILYFIFSLCFFVFLDKQKSALITEIKELQKQITIANTQFTALKQIPTTPTYQAWVKQHRSLTKLEEQYKYLLQLSPSIQMQKVMKILLEPHNGITLAQVKNSPEKNYIPKVDTTTLNTNISEQPIVLTFEGKFFDIVQYLSYLEQALPNIFWARINYHVEKYPIARVEMEMSILYEKK